MRSLVVACALLAALPAIARAAAPGMNLSWVSCDLTAATANFDFACDDNTLARNLVVSYRLHQNTTDFVGVAVILEYSIGDPGTPPWFEFGPGGCREGSFAPIDVGTIGGCTNPYAGANQFGGFVTELLRPNVYRLRAEWARDDPAPQTAQTLYAALVVQLTTLNSFDEGSGYCAGCEAPVCFILVNVQVFTESFGGIYADLSNADQRRWATYRGPGAGCGCPCVPPGTRNGTWGAVKALYR